MWERESLSKLVEHLECCHWDWGHGRATTGANEGDGRFDGTGGGDFKARERDWRLENGECGPGAPLVLRWQS